MIKIICFGKIKENYLKELINDYKKRISKYHKIDIIELKDDDDIQKETRELLKIYNPKDYNIALSIKGISYDSIGFASKIDSIFNCHSSITFIIGGSNGLDNTILDKCDLNLSFSPLTFPHGLFRAILLEQIYRSFKINNNESYHK